MGTEKLGLAILKKWIGSIAWSLFLWANNTTEEDYWRELALCEDCGLPYQEFGLDTALSNEQWREIHPERSEGLLCANCIMKRASLVCNAVVVKVIIMKTKDYYDLSKATEITSDS